MSESSTLTTKESKDKALMMKKKLEKNMKSSPVNTSSKEFVTIGFDADVQDINNDLTAYINSMLEPGDREKLYSIILYYVNVKEHAAIRTRILQHNFDVSQYNEEMKLAGVVEFMKRIKDTTSVQ